jgi:spermidine/putrescine transport system ATP-binding protein
VTFSAERSTMIEFRDIQKYYGDYHALRGINGTIKAGEFFSLLGPSGCGKTTLLRTIAGFEGIDSGAVLIDGKDMKGVPPNVRPTNMVFQSYAIFPHMSVAENVAFGLRRDPRSRAEKASAVEEALQMVGLKGFGARAAHALSGGQRQRVALARALILKPKVLLLDEPLSALDKKMREHMQVELIKLQRQVGITFILVTHDQEEALVMSDRIAVMFEGQIAQLADPETLYRRPNSKKVADFIGTMNFLPCSVLSEAGGRIEIEAQGLGRVTLTEDQAPPPRGESPVVGLRPETLTLLYPGQTTAERVVGGKVDEAIYFGDMTYYDVYLDGTDIEVRLSMRNVPGRPILDVGEQVKVAWSPEALVLFR